MSKIKFAIIGTGRIAPRHAESLQQIEDAELVACVDINPEKVKAFTGKFGGKAFTSIKELMQWGEFDVATICTPSGMHAEHAIEVMLGHKHVVVEKPMALKIEDAENMIATAKKNDVKLFVVKQNRFNLPVLALRKALDEGRFGKPVLGTVRVRWCRDQSYYDQASWRGTWALDGGVFSNQASHHIDLLEWCMGDVESVVAHTTTRLVNIECEDVGTALLKFKSGALGVIEATTATRPKDLEGSLSVMGDKGSVEIAGFAVNKIRHFNFVPELPADKETVEKFSENPPNVYGFGHLHYFKNVVEDLKGKSRALVTGEAGLKSLRLINALYMSVEKKREIFLDKDKITSKLGS